MPWSVGDQVVRHSDSCSQVIGLVAERHLRHANLPLAAAVLLRACVACIDDQTMVVLTNRADRTGA